MDSRGELVVTSSNPWVWPGVRELVLTGCKPGSGPKFPELVPELVVTSCQLVGKLVTTKLLTSL